MMECAESVALLSDFRDGALGEVMMIQVREHLACCPPCEAVYRELDIIVTTAGDLRDGQGVSCPDENVLWARMRIAKSAAY